MVIDFQAPVLTTHLPAPPRCRSTSYAHILTCCCDKGPGQASGGFTYVA